MGGSLSGWGAVGEYAPTHGTRVRTLCARSEVDQIQNLLGSLSREAAEIIAYENAKNIFP